MAGVLTEVASAVPVIHYFLSCSPLTVSYLLLFAHLLQYGGLLTVSEIPSHRDQKTIPTIFPQSQETVLGKDFQTGLFCATWKAAFSLAVIGSDSLNLSRSYPSHSVGSRVARAVDTPNPARLDVYVCTKSRQETAPGRAGSSVESCFWSPISAAALASVPLGKMHCQSLRHPGNSHWNCLSESPTSAAGGVCEHEFNCSSCIF